MGNLRNFRKRKRADQKVLHENHPRPGGRKGQFTQEFDGNAYQAKIAVRCTVFPDLNDAALQDSYKAMGAEKLITTMLTPRRV